MTFDPGGPGVPCEYIYITSLRLSCVSLKVYAHVQNAYTFVFFTYNKTAEQNLIPVRKEPRPVAAPTAFSLDKLLRVLGAGKFRQER